MLREEVTTASWLGGAWLVKVIDLWVAPFWNGFLEPFLHGVLMILTVIGATIMVANRVLDYRIKKRKLSEDNAEKHT